MALEWSKEKYATVFHSYSDNLLGNSFQKRYVNCSVWKHLKNVKNRDPHFDLWEIFYRLCFPVPIDVVYTWVNGSDPLMLSQLKEVHSDMVSSTNISAVSASG